MRPLTLLVSSALVLSAVLTSCSEGDLPTSPPSSSVVPALSVDQGALASPLGETTSDRCTLGDTRRIFESIIVGNEILLSQGPDHPRADRLIHCQYRLFWEDGHPLLGGPPTFSEADVFLGGINGFIPYERLGIDRADAIAMLERRQVRTWLAEITESGMGPLVEQQMMRSGFKNFMTRRLGLVVAQHWAFITRLPAGRYLSVTEVQEGPTVDVLTVELQISKVE